MGPITVLAYGAVALGIVRLLYLLWLHVYGDVREARQQARMKHLADRKARYTPKVSVVVVAESFHSPVAEYLDAVRASEYTLHEIILAVPADSHIYYQVRYYRQKRKLGANLKIVKQANVSSALRAAQPYIKGRIVLLLHNSALPHPDTIRHGILPFRDRPVAVVVPAISVHIGNTLLGGLRAVRHIVVSHFRRGRTIARLDAQGGILIRAAHMRRLLKQTPDASIAELAAMTGRNNSKTAHTAVRHRDTVLALPAAPSGPHFSDAVWGLIDLAAITALFYMLGPYQGLIVLLFAAGFVLFLAAIAIFSAKNLRFINQINLVLLSPFSYAWQIVVGVLRPTRLL